jgi:hypothetical protein
MRESGSFGYPSGARYGIYTAYSAAVKMVRYLVAPGITTHVTSERMEKVTFNDSLHSVCDTIVNDCFRKFGSVALTENDIWYWV